VWAIWQEAFSADSAKLFVILAGFGSALMPANLAGVPRNGNNELDQFPKSV
jgi:hypothetical protein